MSIWKPILMPGVPDRFVASGDGIIKTLEYETIAAYNERKFVRHMPERILKPRINNQSPSLGRHPVVGLHISTTKGQSIHREIRVAKLVAVAFYGLPFDTTDQREIQRWRIAFRDDDVLNCSASNLRWVYNAGPGQNADTGEKLQTIYEKNLDGWLKRKEEGASAILSRLYGEVFNEKEAA